MKWLLVFITYWDGQIMTIGDGVFPKLIDCLEARHELSEEVGGRNGGRFPVNMQAICMRIEPPKKDSI